MIYPKYVLPCEVYYLFVHRVPGHAALAALPDRPGRAALAPGPRQHTAAAGQTTSHNHRPAPNTAANIQSEYD